MALGRINIRQYRPSDFVQIRALLFEGFVTSQDSVTLVAQRRFQFKFPTPLAYLMCGAGLGLLARADGWPLLSSTTGAGALLVAAGIALFPGIQRAMNKFCHDALAADLRALSRPRRVLRRRAAALSVYGRKRRKRRTGGRRRGGRGLRRPRIPPRTRRRRAAWPCPRRGSCARSSHIPGLRCIELNTSAYQPGAQRLYERFGWAVFQAETRAPTQSANTLLVDKNIIEALASQTGLSTIAKSPSPGTIALRRRTARPRRTSGDQQIRDAARRAVGEYGHEKCDCKQVRTPSTTELNGYLWFLMFRGPAFLLPASICIIWYHFLATLLSWPLES
ncbi:hypothetical protein FB451DRAFT_1187445 [Mycena latifolia]|nr:hypothetical protein FB451DRAFT_1187445 [Mycena latifolia]